MEVHTDRAEYEEPDLEQQEASATALTSPLYTKNELIRKNDKKTQVETCDKFIIAANTEDLKLKNHNKFKEPKSAEISANYEFSKNATLRLTWRPDLREL